ncbi:hypothetical protein IMSAGC005_04054 [Lachnospiraceae bacterium]|nr:hypothetical protein IMSAGC005_04054 [Lachnospiraceae bacterium]
MDGKYTCGDAECTGYGSGRYCDELSGNGQSAAAAGIQLLGREF